MACGVLVGKAGVDFLMTDGWTVDYIWRRMHWPTRLDVLVLEAMLAYVIVVVIYVSYRCHAAHRENGSGSPDRQSKPSLRKLICGLSIRITNLKTIATVAPYLGLGGTCLGILFAFDLPAAHRRSAIVDVSTSFGVSLITLAAGILVAPLALWAHNFLRVRLERLEGELPGCTEKTVGSQIAQRLPLASRFSLVPRTLVGAPVFGILVVVFGLLSYHASTGLPIGFAPLRCDGRAPERMIVIRVAKDGKLFLNFEQESEEGLRNRLVEIYRMKVDRTIYVNANDDAPFQAVVNAMDIAESVGINVELVTRSVIQNHCAEPRDPTIRFSK